MAVYFDTSFLLPYFVAEAASAQVERFMSRQAPEELLVSQWTIVEFHSAIALKIRSGAIAASAQMSILEHFELACADTLRVELPVAADFALARQWLLDWSSGLRGGDALHLAIARNRHATLLTLDKTLLKVAQALRIPARSLSTR